MKRGWLSFVAVGCVFSAANALAQTTTTGTPTTAPSVGDSTPTENLQTVGARGPSVTVNAARARHLQLRNNRLAYQHGAGEATNGAGANVGGGDNSTGSDSISDALGSLINSGGLGSLAGLLGGDVDLNSLLGGTGGTSGTNPNIPSNITPEVIQMLQGAGINIDDLFPSEGTSGTSKSLSTDNLDDSKTAQRSQAASILMDRWPGKEDARSQTTGDTEEQSFGDRWKEQMALTFFRNLFTGITAGLSSPQLIGNIEDALRPILRPDSVPADE